jgi:hypothetical protein
VLQAFEILGKNLAVSSSLPTSVALAKADDRRSLHHIHQEMQREVKMLPAPTLMHLLLHRKR